MKVIGLAGGIGAGKSSVSSRLRDREAAIVDGDIVARELQEPGEPVFTQMVATFGDGIVAPDGRLDRQAVADIVFSDLTELARLTAITTPAIEAEIHARILEHAGSDDVVVVDAALIQVRHQYGEQATIVVDVDPELAVERLVLHRGMSEADARNRIANQQSRAERLAIADFVIDNNGTADDLDDQVAKAWAWIESLPPWAPES